MSEVITTQIKPLNDSVACIWENPSSDYPDLIKIPMADGRVISYRREVVQPEPRVQKCIDIIKIMNQCTYGGYKPRRRNKNGR